MFTKILTIGFLTVLLGACSNAPQVKNSNSGSAPVLGGDAKKVRAIFAAKCQSCHDTNESSGSRLDNVVDLDLLVDAGFVKPGKPDSSPVYLRIANNSMPPSGSSEISDDEKTLIERWIVSLKDKDDRELVSFSQVLGASAEDLQKVAKNDRPFMRYLSFAHLYSGGEESNYLTRIGGDLSRLVNSLSRLEKLSAPVLVDEEKYLFRIDIRNYGWDVGAWTRLEEQYPYTYPYANKYAKSLRSLAKTKIPVIKADWFMDKVSVAPLYYALLGLPGNLNELATDLGMDLDKNVTNQEIIRAGYDNSAVAKAQRVIERHDQKPGFFWRSYEFAQKGAGSGEKDIFASPMGPKSITGQGFSHDGSEIIYSLKNGMLAFYVADADGRRLTAAPQIQIGNQNIAANVGLACMHCHKAGLIVREDQVLDKFLNSSPEVEAFVKAVYADAKTLRNTIADDTQLYQKALKELKLDPDSKDAILENSKKQNGVMTLKQVAAELDIKSNELNKRLEAIAEAQPIVNPQIDVQKNSEPKPGVQTGTPSRCTGGISAEDDKVQPFGPTFEQGIKGFAGQILKDTFPRRNFERCYREFMLYLHGDKK